MRTERAFASPARWTAVWPHRRAVFGSFVERARHALDRGDLSGATVAASVAAQYAWRCHFGSLTDPHLEDVLEGIGLALGPVLPPRRTDHRSVLHMATAVGSVGGHTRMMCRWIEEDDSHRHDLVLTGQQARYVPQEVRGVLHARGGTVIDLRGAALLERIRGLARVAAGYGRCVVHHNPDDVLPGIVLAMAPRATSTIVVNHADHVFWTGIRSADAVACIRPAAARVADRHRGCASQRTAVVPIALGESPGPIDREAVRSELGIAPDTVLAVTVASEYKYGGARGPHFVDRVRPALEQHPGLQVLAVGPRPVARWRAAQAATGGQIRALGSEPSVGKYLAAADFYIDSYPFPSFTSLLEAAQAGLPAVAWRMPHPEQSYLEPDDPAITPHLIWAFDDAASALGELVGDAAERRRRGRALAQGAYERSRGWRDRLERAYAVADECSARPPADPPAVAVSPWLAAAVADVHNLSGIDGGFITSMRARHEDESKRQKLRRLLGMCWSIRRDRPTWAAWATNTLLPRMQVGRAGKE